MAKERETRGVQRVLRRRLRLGAWVLGLQDDQAVLPEAAEGGGGTKRSSKKAQFWSQKDMNEVNLGLTSASQIQEILFNWLSVPTKASIGGVSL